MSRPSITSQIIGAAIKIHRRLGPGLLESAYEACLPYELENAGLRVQRQKPVPLIYNSVKLDCGFRADMLVNEEVVVEIKSKDALHPGRPGATPVASSAPESASWTSNQLSRGVFEGWDQTDGEPLSRIAG